MFIDDPLPPADPPVSPDGARPVRSVRELPEAMLAVPAIPVGARLARFKRWLPAAMLAPGSALTVLDLPRSLREALEDPDLNVAACCLRGGLDRVPPRKPFTIPWERFPGRSSGLKSGARSNFS